MLVGLTLFYLVMGDTVTPLTFVNSLSPDHRQLLYFHCTTAQNTQLSSPPSSPLGISASSVVLNTKIHEITFCHGEIEMRNCFVERFAMSFHSHCQFCIPTDGILDYKL